MSYAIFAGPVVALIGVVAVFFVLRRKSVDKRSMYSARRSQIEHKVRAARQRTLTPHGHAEKPAEGAPEAASSPFAPAPGAPVMTFETATYQSPPSAPAPPSGAPTESAWGPTAPPPGPSPFATPSSEPAYPPPPEPAYQPPAAPAYQPPPEPEPYQPPAYQPPQAEPTPPAEPAWTPAPGPLEPATHIDSPQPSAAAASGSSWEIVGDSKDMSAGVQQPEGKKDKRGPGGPSWQLASGDAPGTEADDVVKPPSAAASIALYAILVVGLVMVLIGVLVMIANSHGT